MQLSLSLAQAQPPVPVGGFGLVGGACPASQVGSAIVSYGIPPHRPQVERIAPFRSQTPTHCKHRRPRAAMLQPSHPAAYFGSWSPRRPHVALGYPTREQPWSATVHGVQHSKVTMHVPIGMFHRVPGAPPVAEFWPST